MNTTEIIKRCDRNILIGEILMWASLPGMVYGILNLWL